MSKSIYSMSLSLDGFPRIGPDAALELVDSQSTQKGVTVQVYRLAGRPQYAT